MFLENFILSSFVRIYHKKDFIEINPFKTFKMGTNFLATHLCFLELINVSNKYKLNKIDSSRRMRKRLFPSYKIAKLIHYMNRKRKSVLHL